MVKMTMTLANMAIAPKNTNANEKNDGNYICRDYDQNDNDNDKS